MSRITRTAAALLTVLTLLTTFATAAAPDADAAPPAKNTYQGANASLFTTVRSDVVVGGLVSDTQELYLDVSEFNGETFVYVNVAYLNCDDVPPPPPPPGEEPPPPPVMPAVADEPVPVPIPVPIPCDYLAFEFGSAPALFDLDRKLDGATASALVELFNDFTGEVRSVEIDLSWTGTGDTQSYRDHLRIDTGDGRITVRTDNESRAATVDGLIGDLTVVGADGFMNTWKTREMIK